MAFWNRVAIGAADDCWPWEGCRNPQWYGTLKWRRRTDRAHRIAYELVVGPIPIGLCVCHHCDNPPCCNPAHLFLGTIADNNADKVAKGRAGRTGKRSGWARGEGHGCARLTTADVIALRRRHVEGESQSSLAREFGVHVSTVHLVVHRKKWAHVA